MIIDLIQTRKELFKAEFIIKRGDNEVGAISLKGWIGSMEAVIQGRFDKRAFEMCHKRRNRFIVSKAFHPYLIKENWSYVKI